MRGAAAFRQPRKEPLGQEEALLMVRRKRDGWRGGAGMGGAACCGGRAAPIGEGSCVGFILDGRVQSSSVPGFVLFCSGGKASGSVAGLLHNGKADGRPSRVRAGFVSPGCLGGRSPEREAGEGGLLGWRLGAQPVSGRGRRRRLLLLLHVVGQRARDTPKASGGGAALRFPLARLDRREVSRATRGFQFPGKSRLGEGAEEGAGRQAVPPRRQSGSSWCQGAREARSLLLGSPPTSPLLKAPPPFQQVLGDEQGLKFGLEGSMGYCVGWGNPAAAAPEGLIQTRPLRLIT